MIVRRLSRRLKVLRRFRNNKKVASSSTAGKNDQNARSTTIKNTTIHQKATNKTLDHDYLPLVWVADRLIGFLAFGTGVVASRCHCRVMMGCKK